MLEKHSEWKGRIAGHGFLKASIINPEYRQMCRIFVSYLAGQLRGHPALVSYCLANEPQFEDYSAPMQERFRNFLKQAYPSISTLNQTWEAHYTNWDEILINRISGYDRSNTARYLDWVKFNWEIGSEYISFLNDLVKKHDLTVATHAKTLPLEFGVPWIKPGKQRDFYDYADGVNRMSWASITTLIGTDTWADCFWKKNGTVYQSMYLELLRSYADKTKPIFDSEWHIINVKKPAPPQYVTMTMQLNVINGLRAGAFWVGHPLVEPSDIVSSARLLLETGLVAARMRHLHPQYLALANRSRPIAILYSPTARYLQGDPYIITLQRLFEVGLSTGLGIGLIDERQLIAGETEGIKAIITINCTHTMEKTPAALDQFAESGGQVRVLGVFATKNENEISMSSTRVEHLTLEKDFSSLYLMFRKLGAAVIDNLPQIAVVSQQDKPIEGLRWHTAQGTDGNIILFIANTNLEPVTFKINSIETLSSMVTGKISQKTQTLPPFGVFFGSLKK